jgi:hypothetical protein
MSKTIEGVKRALNERNNGGGDLTVALLKRILTACDEQD